jgi:hypothetical protein
MEDLQDIRERLRRWGWVGVALGLPGLGLLGYTAYIALIEGPFSWEVFLVSALLASPLPIGARMIARGWGMSDSRLASDPWVRANTRRGPFLTLAALFAGGFGVFALSMPACGCSTREKAYVAAMRSDLKNLASQQEIYFSDHRTYSADPVALAFVTSDGVVVQVEATLTGWTARAWHEGLGAGVACVMWYGDAPHRMRTDGGDAPREAGVLACDDRPA